MKKILFIPSLILSLSASADRPVVTVDADATGLFVKMDGEVICELKEYRYLRFRSHINNDHCIVQKYMPAAIVDTHSHAVLYSTRLPASKEPDKKCSESLTGDTEWTRLSICFKPTSRWSYISLELEGTGKVWFDNGVITKQDDNESEKALGTSPSQPNRYLQ